MLWMLLIGWIVLLPAIVVAGLYVSSSVLGRRRAALHAYEDLFAEADALESALEQESAELIADPPNPMPPGAGGSADTTAADRPTVAARY